MRDPEEPETTWVLFRLGIMSGQRLPVCTFSRRDRWRQRDTVSARPDVDIELDTLHTHPRRIDSGISISGLTLVSEDHTIEPRVDSRPEEPMHLKLDFGAGMYVKPLDYRTFSHWSAIEELMMDLEKDGMRVGDLWDESEEMSVCGGDWDARVRPGWTLQMHCQGAEASLGSVGSACDSGSEETEDDAESWFDDMIDEYQEEWCLPRWRNRVEHDGPTGKELQEPSWAVLSLGLIVVIFSIAAFVVYTT